VVYNVGGANPITLRSPFGRCAHAGAQTRPLSGWMIPCAPSYLPSGARRAVRGQRAPFRRYSVPYRAPLPRARNGAHGRRRPRGRAALWAPATKPGPAQALHRLSPLPTLACRQAQQAPLVGTKLGQVVASLDNQQYSQALIWIRWRRDSNPRNTPVRIVRPATGVRSRYPAGRG
jgi:hypothetical protein